MLENKMIPITKPFFDLREIKNTSQAIKSGWVTQGPWVRKFEEKFSQYVKTPYACATSSCTSALHMALLTVGVKPGDIVLTVSHSFIATANSVRYCLAEPFFIDVESGDYNISSEKLESFLKNHCSKKSSGLFYKKIQNLKKKKFATKDFYQQKLCGRISAILVVHQLGFPCDLKKIMFIAAKFGLPVIEDAAYAVGSEISLNNGRTFEKIGKPHGDIACFSFHPRKMLVTGEGGMLTTRNPSYDKRFRLLRHQGMSVSDLKRHHSKKIIFEEYKETAYNYRMTDIQAAIGCAQVEKMPDMISCRRQIALDYQMAFKDIDWIILPAESQHIRYNWSNYPIQLKENAPLKQKEFMQHLLNHGIATRPGVMNSHNEKPYFSEIWNLPETEIIRKKTVLMPIFPQMTKKQIKKIIKVVKDA